MTGVFRRRTQAPARPLVVAVDFDGVIVMPRRRGEDFETMELRPVPGAKEGLRELVSAGYMLVLWTCRSGKALENAERWIADNDLPVGIPEEAPGKIWADFYLDDKAVGAPLCWEGIGVYVDWAAVVAALIKN